jgi:putative restriction endonuclease
MDKEEIRRRIAKLNVWRRGDQRAPHKPLLILYAIGRCLRGEDRLIPYSDVDQDLKKLLAEFGPPRQSCHPEYPFWRLQSDGLWELPDAENLTRRRSSSDVPKTELLRNNIHGGFKQDVFQLISSDRRFLTEIVTDILNATFPASIHGDILQAVGIDLEETAARAQVRDPYFRDRVLRAYEYQCAVCGFNVRIGDSLVALEAAHIKWHQAGGPDSEENGIALCTLHHKLFDRGAFTISEEMRLKVSERAHGTLGFQEWLMKFHGHAIRPPQRQAYYPGSVFVDWHVREVFKGYPRQL